MPVTIPPPVAEPFTDGIRHPDLYLWDAWSFVAPEGDIHLYSLAVSRTKADGSDLTPAERNSFPFHIRHFTSTDDGASWADRGSLLEPRSDPASPDARTIWSGSIAPLPDSRILLAYTGLYELGPEQCFLQNLMLALTDGDKVTWRASTPVLCPRRDWDMITQAGYYLADREALGHSSGEAGGPIMAWRDPFIFIDHEGVINLFFSAKTDAGTGAMGRATLRPEGDGFQLDRLFPPIPLPDSAQFTQFELPKIYRDATLGNYILIGSTCSRRHENQPDSEVEKMMRIYRSASVDGPWQPCGNKGSELTGLDFLFGMTVLRHEHQANSLLCMAPYTDVAEADKGLTFAPAFRLDLDLG